MKSLLILLSIFICFSCSRENSNNLSSLELDQTDTSYNDTTNTDTTLSTLPIMDTVLVDSIFNMIIFDSLDIKIRKKGNYSADTTTYNFSFTEEIESGNEYYIKSNVSTGYIDSLKFFNKEGRKLNGILFINNSVSMSEAIIDTLTINNEKKIFCLTSDDKLIIQDYGIVYIKENVRVGAAGYDYYDRIESLIEYNGIPIASDSIFDALTLKYE